MNNEIVLNTTIRKRLLRSLLLLLVMCGGDATTAMAEGGVKVNGNVYGGGNTADVQGNAEVNVTSGTVVNDVYGGGKGQTTVVSGDVTVNIGKETTEGNTTTYSGNGTVKGSVYGGSALGAVNAKKEEGNTEYSGTEGAPKVTIVNVLKGTVNGSVYGGGLGDNDTQAKVFGDATVNIGAAATTATPTVVGSVYGGSNVNGVSISDVYVNIIRGNITGTVTGGKLINGNVHGGGEGRLTLVNGNVTVNMGTKSADDTPVFTGAATIYGDIYGGSALGNVNANSASDFNTNKTTAVNLYKGTVKGNIYGGGLGQKGVGSEGDPGYVEDIPAYVGGAVTVELNNGVPNTEKGCVVEGSIFGCNNENGSPKGAVTVHIYKTQNAAADHIAIQESDSDPNATNIPKKKGRYDVAAVYGGGNQAAYNPTDAANSKTIVEIEGCNETSINYVYGGGNAAPVPESKVTINSCYEVNYLFGGGNGAGEGNPGADVGIIDKVAYATDNETGIYGTGIASTTLVGGTINYVYGGSNTLGNVRGGTSLVRTETNDDCPLKVGEIYGAGQVAPMDGDVNIVLECMPDEFVDKVFGGAKNATINGNVSLTVTSGKYGRVFGGNNEGGSINGSIMVNVYEDGCEPLIIGELYGGGYNAPYSIWGCNDDDNDGTWTANPTPNNPSVQPHVAANADAIKVNVFSCTSIGKVFGGGYGSTAQVIGNTHVWVNTMQGIVDGNKQTYSTEPNVYIGKIGQVFGGGNAAPVKGDVTIDIGTATVSESYSKEEIEKIGINIISGTDYLAAESNTTTSITAGIYGGGYSADLDGNVTLNIGTVSQNQGINIGGSIFGGGYGETTHVTGSVTVNIGTNESGTPVGYANITSDVYGGSAKGKVNSYIDNNTETASEGKTTQVNLFGGTISGNLYGGGLGEETHAADVYGPVTVNVEGGYVNNVFGCNNVLGSPKSTATVNINGTPVPEAPASYIIENVYGGGNQAAYNGTGGVSVQMSGGYVNNVFGGGLGATAIVNEGTTVTLNGGTVTNDIYGGGSQADVTGAVNVRLNGGTVARDVYGGGALAQTNTSYDATEHPTYTTSVALAGATITGNLYGGGLGDKAELGENHSDVAANVNGPVTVTVSNGYAANVFGCNNINGMPTGTVAVNITNTGDLKQGMLYAINGVYGGGNVAPCTGSPTVTVSGGHVNYVYGGGLGETAVTGGASVNIAGGSIKNDVYGGGSLADVTGNVSVSVSGGTVTHEVYGGGALANTNTGNWDTAGSAFEYVEVTGLTPAEYQVKAVENGASVVGYYILLDGNYIEASGTAENGTTYYERTVQGSSVAGYYTRSGSEGSYVYTPVTTGAALSGTTYYRKKVVGSWITGNNGESGTTYKTNVTLTGGLIGNAYGGGLGRLYKAASGTEPEITAVEAMVYGDVKITVNDPTVIGSAPGVAFTQETEEVTYGEGDKRKQYIIPINGRVFGCNNQNGTPTGNVRVEVYSTRQIDANNAIISGHGSPKRKYPYEIQAIYGGGNLSDYLPADGKGTSVYVEGCEVTSIEKVYGGGNSASVPATDVTIKSCYDVGYGFGGGNGGDLIKKNNVWIENEGAIVIGLASITPMGGKIGQVFGGSDAKGVCGSTNVDLSKQDQSDCPLVITRIYGAGNEADVATDVNMIISGCTSAATTIGGESVNTQIEYVYGGSYNAHITGNVTLTITAGVFKYVYGGNDRTGSISGNITVNIEESKDCKPIIIENLLGGGNEAPYPGTRRNGSEITTRGKITVNVKSATYIGNIYGGSYKADVNGDTEVNINMTRGKWAGEDLTGYDDLPNVHDGKIDPAVGTIGNVFGGGNQGLVRGNSTVNICTEEVVPIMKRDGAGNVIADYNSEGMITSISYEDATVYGAHITGDVYGGGNLADVKGNTEVNICAKKNGSGYDAMQEGTDKVTIGGNVFGGGKGSSESFTCERAMVGTDGHGIKADEGNTSVTIGNGKVGGSVYGGGEIARVENNTAVTIGIGDGVETGTGTATSSPEIANYVFGAGKGINSHGYSALVRGGASVTIGGNAKVGQSVYGGGEIATVGTFKVKLGPNNPEGAPDNVPVGMPYELKNDATGKCTVTIGGYAEIGPNDMKMPTFTGHVFGAGKGFLPNDYSYTGTDKPQRMQPGNTPDVFDTEAAYITFVETLGMSAETDVTIKGHAFIKGSVYGGSENGHVLHDTYVKIQDYCQVGNGDGKNARYTEEQWTGESASDFAECNHWEYGHKVGGTEENPIKVYLPYDVYDLQADGKTPKPASDGHTFYGNVFGGGSGYFPYRKSSIIDENRWVIDAARSELAGQPVDANGYSDGKWLRSAGSVNGNTRVDITGGHILTSVYGGNEQTDVGKYSNNSNGDPLVLVSGGTCKVNMVGGTLGVPRTDEQMTAHPVTCYLFGAGKGDQRINFNTWTNVASTEVNITGSARIFGSTFGGGEDGHVLGNAVTNIGGSVEIDGTTYTNTNVKIGTTGTSYVDGNVFGGGRGFSGEALTAGSTGENADVTISGGTMLGSVYGGGRLASIGIGFSSPDDDSYGQLIDDTSGSDVTHGHIRVTISGGTIGNDVQGAQYGGNVFGAGMGRNTLLNGSLNPLWPKVATSKTTTVNISGGTIKKNVYGGAEFGVVRNQATVTISGTADIKGSVYGGGKGSDDYQHLTPIKVGGYNNLYYSFTPMLWNGVVAGNTIVNINGGTVGMNVYGGGELASVGLIDFVSDENGNFTNMPKHTSLTDGFGLSWPYKFTYHAAAPYDAAPGGNIIGGKATVTITGGHIGSSTWNDGTGYVFGGGKGKVEFGITSISDQRYTEAFCANVRETEVNINYGSTPTDKNSLNIGAEANCIMGAVYGGGEDGHVYENTAVNITGGLIGLSVYGAGKGISMYKGYLRDQNTEDFKNTTEDLYSWTAGKVYGNATVTMTDGHVLNNVYGGGYLGSVGKGNYAGGADDYYKEGYGETLLGNLWASTTEGDNAWQFLNSGKATVKIKGGTIGTLNGTYGNVGGSTDPTPSGMVFGGSRGQSAEDVKLNPRYEYAPNFYLGYVNNTEVTIGTTEGGAPRIYSQVFGGGRDGHVRGDAHVIVNNGIIGQTYAETDAVAGSTADYQRYHRGNVYGSGSGLGQWTTGKHGMSSGSVTRNTTVDINGGTIYNNVYGGGALSSVGPPRLDPEKDYAPADWSKCVVNINGGTIGDPTVYDKYEYGGCVYGASRGNDFATDESPDNFATVLWTQVKINDGNIAGNVYGGAKGGLVWKDTEVNLKGGRIYHDAYGGGQGTTTPNIAANVGGTTVELNNNVATTDKGCIVERIFGCNDLNGTPRGHVKVHVHATQNKSTENISTKIAPSPYSTKRNTSTKPEEGYKAWLTRLIGIAKPEGTVLTELDATVITNAETTLEGITTDEASLTNDQKKTISETALTVIKEIEKQHDYDVKAVYGGGNLAPYEPYGPDANNTEADFKATKENTEVIIEGCDVTSIKQVYGGGNAASVPATQVSVRSVFIIDELFGGGNGFDKYTINDKWYGNPGANVGYYATEEHVTDGTKGDGESETTAYQTQAKANTSTKEDRIAYYAYGSGRAETTVTGGHIHTVYGGSNEKGNIREVALSQYQKSGTCPLITDESYGGSKTAEMDGEIQVVMDCVEDGGIYYGGSQNADINNNVTINITNGTYNKVYGGNNKAGTINGAITINIEEKGCTPIIIGELYGGGYYAPYSVYGYKKKNDGTYETITETDPTDNTKTIESRIPLQAGDEGALATPHRDPYINIISATEIGTIYGGGDQALVVGSPHVNVNMQEGIILEEYAKKLEGYSSLTVDNGGRDADGNKILPIGTIGAIFGGGHLASVIGNTYVDIGTGSWYNYKTNTTETITRNAAQITGNVFGGGEGVATETGDDAFTCAKAMVGRDGGGVTNSQGNTSVIIGNGSIGGSVYGGGKIGRVENNTSVTIGIQGNKTNELTIGGNVFGASQGVATHGYSGLARGNSTVIIQGKAKVLGSVYGGGEMATVGKYVVEKGIPVRPDGGGLCSVTVRDDAEIGPDDMKMQKYDTNGNPLPPDDTGYVFGAGKGVTPSIYNFTNDANKPWHVTKTDANPNGIKVYSNDDADYLAFIETLGLAANTSVTISGNAFIKGSVYGGAENGYVQQNTHVTIEGNCQIGNGYVQMDDNGTYLTSPYSLNRRYTDDEWTDGHLYTDGESNYQHSLPECASWQYRAPYAAYDKFANATGDLDKYEDGTSTEGGRLVGSNGQTFYGNVFGGGSGYYPYKAGKWHFKAGSVGGNTVVDITGGHILTNIYGGNEMTNVTGNATVNFGGTATLGVPRTLGQIAAHPVTCYLFGAGKGDPRVMFNKNTNVQNVTVNVTGGTIYGSVFGGGEDGHVMGNVTMNIGNEEGTGPTIGTWGTSYVDGNVFGGGRGFEGDAYTAGNVAGSVTMNISGGTMLGSVYGGGRLGSVGYGLYAETEIETTDGHKMYGEMQDDGYGDWYQKNGTYVRDAKTDFKRGHVEINISGDNTVIGNEYEFKYINPQTTGDALATATANMPSTQLESNNRLKHTRGGNVFAGGMGRYTQLDGSTPISSYNESGILSSPIEWKKLGNVKSTKLTISGNPWIMGNVYGGGEYGAVTGYHTTEGENYSTEIIFSGGTIGTEITASYPVKGTIDVPESYPTSGNSEVKYTFGSIYGGGMGQETPDGTGNHGGEVSGNTTVTMSGKNTKVRASVFGGGEMAIVDGNTNVTISGGEIGRNEVKPLSDPDAGYVLFGGATMGNVYGGGKGILGHTEAGQVKGNTNVTISGGNVYHMVYGGGALGSVGGFKISDGNGNPSYIPISGVPYGWDTEADGVTPNGKSTGTATVTITGGTIGISGRDNGLVFGSSRGGLQKPVEGVDPYDKVAWVNKSVVTIGTKRQGIEATQPQIKCSVYGGGENGHNNESATVNIYSGTIGITDTEDPWYNFGTNETVRAKAQRNRGNVYGAGSGSDTYTGDDGKEHYNPKSGMVGGNTFVNIAGGHIGRSVYGGGAMASVGTITSEEKHESETTSFALSWPYKFEFAKNTGKATVNVTGGHIGTRQLDGGDVYGSSRGEAGDRYATAHLAVVKETEVNVNYPTTEDMPDEATIQNDFTIPCVTGSVHGSGEDGYVYGDTHVTLNNGLIGHSLYGAGKGAGTYSVKLLKIGAQPKQKVNESDPDEYDESDYYESNIYSLISGKVMGNTNVTMNGGHVGRNVYGGGNMASVGKGNYAGGEDDYSTAGYGETLEGNLWDNVSDNSKAFLSSGKATVKVLGGMVGYINKADPSKSIKNNLPYGNVFGGSAGEAAPNVDRSLSPRYHYCPSFFSGYVNETDVTIGAIGTTGPTILGSVYGGGQDGHVRRWTQVDVNSGTIGLPFNSENQEILGNLKTADNKDNTQWLHRGNVYGAGSGISEYTYNKVTTTGSTTEKGYSTSAGSVTHFTEVNVKGGTIYRNVLGGGSLATVGSPKIKQPDYAAIKGTTPADWGKQSLNLVTIGGGLKADGTVNLVEIGEATGVNAGYGGNVFGGSRGEGEATLGSSFASFATSIWTRVHILNGAHIRGNVFGGGNNGEVMKDSDVIIGEKADGGE